MFEERWKFIARGKCNAQTEGVAWGLPIPPPKGNKFPYFPQTYEVLFLLHVLPIHLFKILFLFMWNIFEINGYPFA